MKYSIADYGAVTGAETPQTGAIQRAIDDCWRAGGGEVVVPSGTFLTGSIRIRSGVTLHLLENAVLAGSRDPEDYMGILRDELEPLGPEDFECGSGTKNPGVCACPAHRWNNGLIRAVHARDIGIIGERGSVIDGRDCYDASGEEHYRGPHAINMHDCHGVTLRGYTVRDSANWAHAIFRSGNIDMSRVTVLAGHDGAHFRACRNVSVTNCTFYTGDDCVAGYGNVNFYLADTVMNTACSGMRFGGTNAYIKRCRFEGPAKYLHRNSLSAEDKRASAPSYTREKDPNAASHRYNMLSAFTYFADDSIEIAEQPGNIVVSDCEIENTDRFLHYNYSGNEVWQAERPLGSIRFERVRATGIGMPINAYGSADCPLTLELFDVDMAFRDGADADCVIKAANCADIRLRRAAVRNFSGGCVVKEWEKNGEVEFTSVDAPVTEENRVAAATEEFFAQAI